MLPVLTINGKDFAVNSAAELRMRLAEAGSSQFLEIWIHLDEAADGPAICALVNGESAWLMYLRHNGDSGFSTRNPGYQGPPGAMMPFRLSNGQEDEYPVAWTIPVSEAVKALEYFWSESGGRAPWLKWHEH